MKFLKVTTFTLLATIATQACSANSIQHSGQASKHSALAVKEGVVSTAKVASVAVAVPLLVVGSVGLASASAADSLHRSSHEPMEISDITITADAAPEKVMVKTTTKTETTTTVETK